MGRTGAGMIDSSKRLLLSALTALALGSAACTVSAGGQIPCADDSSCPHDFPVCQAGFCQAGSPSAESAASVSIIGVDGKAAGAPIRSAVTISVSAKAASGIKSVTLTPAGKTAIVPTSSAGG